MRVWRCAPQILPNPQKSATFRTLTRSYTVQTQGGSGAPARHLISTLNASLLGVDDYLDLSGQHEFPIRFPKSRGNTLALLWYEKIARKSSGTTYTPFPDHSNGFLYYHRPQNAAPLEGSVRLCVTAQAGNAPSFFAHGRDLLLPSGCPWQIILPQIACRRHYARIRDQLLEEDLVTDQQLSRCRALFADRAKIRAQSTIFRLTQEFPVNFTNRISLTVVGEAGVHYLRFSAFRIWYQGEMAPHSRALSLPPSPHYSGRRVVHLRFTKTVTPVECTVDGYTGEVSEPKGGLVKPEAGDLLTRSHWNRDPEPWAYDIDANDTDLAAALRVLWDGSVLLAP
ncbi:hypothetical protein MVEN_02246500 [Mycena venus]|uniref:Uncharacterized protein n=1 Tax=Mycena venus TaxID=2733690 RepID=A0A8H6X5N8_9AGAR|nr:hypothetical protein MVEN_02246500 [Mycena venus]